MAKITFSHYTETSSSDADPEKILVFDNVLPDWIVKWGEESMADFDWRYDTRSYPTGNVFFGKTLLDSFTDCRPFPPIVQLVLIGFENYLKENNWDMEIVNCTKILVNGQLPCTPGDPHCDTFMEDYWTLVYYCNDSSGNTEFYKNQEDLTLVKSVEFKQGRIVLFPSFYNHKGCVPEKGLRITFGMQLHIKSSLTPRKLINTIS